MYLFVIIFSYLSAVKVRTLIFWGWFLLPLMWFRTNWMIFCILLKQKKKSRGNETWYRAFSKEDLWETRIHRNGRKGLWAFLGTSSPVSVTHNETWIKMTEEATVFTYILASADIKDWSAQYHLCDTPRAAFWVTRFKDIAAYPVPYALAAP